jgi:hypothetical protein
MPDSPHKKVCEQCKKIIEDESYIFIGIWNNSTKSSSIRFHVDCFRAVAGPEYVDKLVTNSK